MEHFIRIAFWIFTLCATFASCRPSNLKLSDTHIKRMEAEVKCPADSRFYTPLNTSEKCNKIAFECILKELDTAKWECDDENKRINDAIYYLERHLNKTNRAVPDGCSCEIYPQTDFKTFLEKYESLIQHQNTLLGG